MKQDMNRAQKIAVGLLSGCILVASTACNVEVARELVTLSGGYIGDVASVVATQWFADLVGVELESDAHVHEEEDSEDHVHSHDAEPLHNHEH